MLTYGRGGAAGLDEEVMYFMFSMNKYRNDEEFGRTLNSLKNNFQTCRTVRDTLSRSKSCEFKSHCEYFMAKFLEIDKVEIPKKSIGHFEMNVGGYTAK
mgnify:CR=1 FL=1